MAPPPWDAINLVPTPLLRLLAYNEFIHPERLFTEELFRQKKSSIFGLFSGQSASGVFREATLRNSITAPLGKPFNLHEKQHGVGWRWSSHRFHLAHTVPRQGLDPHTALFG